MNVRRAIPCIALSMAAIAIVACDSASEEPVETSAAETWCHGLCQALERCAPEQAGDTCVDECVQDRPGLREISASGARMLEPCLADLRCDEIFEEAAWDAAMDRCWEQAKEANDTGPRVRAFCSDYAEAWFQCSGWLSTDRCERNFSMWAPEVIDDVTSCMGETSCAAFDACVGAVFEDS